MTVKERYFQHGHAFLPSFLPTQAAQAMLYQLRHDLRDVPLTRLEKAHSLLKREAIEIYGYHYAPLITFLWGMTPAVEAMLGKRLLPSYSYFRVYRQGDVCRVHTDRPSCEVSLSLTLAASDGHAWALDMATQATSAPKPIVTDDFEGQTYESLPMRPGDGVLYQGIYRRHGRVTPNPNRWSAHAFLHWVDPAGPHAKHAFDGNGAIPEVDFLQ